PPVAFDFSIVDFISYQTSDSIASTHKAEWDNCQPRLTQ
ncbi:unnamed protein product, partial [marine sediment metagenome]